jgi:hypothetical protein
MKIALCLHGLFNSATDDTSLGLDAYEYIKKHILSKGDVDVFVHSWDVDKKELIKNLYNPKLSLFEPQKDFSDLIIERQLGNLKDAPRSPQTIFSHFYSIQKSFELLDMSGESYDIVIKSRFDLSRINRDSAKHHPTPAQFINFQTDIVNDKLYQAFWLYFDQGPSDIWFYGSQQIMKPFLTIFDELAQHMILDSEYHKFAQSISGMRGDISNAVVFYKWWMINNGMWDNNIALPTEWE